MTAIDRAPASEQLPNLRPRAPLIWMCVLGVMLVLISLRGVSPWLIAFPENWFLPVVTFLNAVMASVVDSTGAFFRGVSAVLDAPM